MILKINCVHYAKFEIISLSLIFILGAQGKTTQMIDKEDQKDQNIIYSLEKGISQEETAPRVSQFMEEYQSYMLSQQKIQKYDLIRKIVENGVRYSEDRYFAKIQIQVIAFIPNLEILQLQVQYGYFTTILTLINIDTCSLSHDLSQVICGSFGNIYRTSIHGQNTVIKCIQFTQDNFSLVFKNVVTEYLILKIAAIIGSGPTLTNSFGFDFLVFRNCIQFCMQSCQSISYMRSKGYVEQQLKDSLKKLHMLQIIHFDIKLDNICYSYQQNVCIFIDFGLSKLVQQPLGQKTLTCFRGSMLYCSTQMENQYLNKTSGFVDVYFNDAECLRKSIKYLCKSDNEEINANQECFINSSKRYDLIFIKACLFTIQKKKQITLRNLLERQSNRLIQDYCVDILQFIKLLPKSIYLRQFIDKYIPDKYNDEKNKIKVRLLTHIKDTTINEQLNSAFLDIYQKIVNINYSEVALKEDNDHQKQIAKISKINHKTNRQIYYLNVANFIRIDYDNRSFEEKIEVASAFIKQEKITQYEIIACPIKKSIIHIFKFSFMLPRVNSKNFIMQMLIVSVIFFQILSEEQLISSFQSVLNLQAPFLIKMRIWFKFFTSLQWITFKFYSKYNYYAILNQVIIQIKYFLLQTQYFCNEIQIALIKVIWKIINQKGSKNSIEMIMNIVDNDHYYKFLKFQIDFSKEIAMYVYDRFMIISVQNSKQYHFPVLQALEYLGLQHHRRKFNFIYIYFTLAQFYERNSIAYKYQYIVSQFTQNFQRYDEFNHFKMIVSHRIHSYQNQQINAEQLIKGLDHFMLLSNTFAIIQVFVQIFSKGRTINKQIIEFIDANFKKIISSFASSIDYEHKGTSFDANFHKNHMLLNNTITVMEYLYSFSSQKTEILKIMIKFLENSHQYIAKQKCISCKIRGLNDILALQAFRLRMGNLYEESFKIYLQLIIFTQKHKQFNSQIFDSIILLINVCNEAKYVQICQQVVAYLYELVHSAHYQQLYLFERNKQIFSQVYLYLYDCELQTQLRDLIDRVAFILSVRFNKKDSRNVYSAIYSIGRQYGLEQKQNFYIGHTWILDRLSRFNPNKKPYLSLYFILLLQFNINNGAIFKIFQFMANSMSLVDIATKQIILNRYYYFFMKFHQMNARKRAFLLRQHYKNTKSKHQTKLMNIIKSNHKTHQMCKQRKDSPIIISFLKSLRRYYQGHNTPIQ